MHCVITYPIPFLQQPVDLSSGIALCSLWGTNRTFVNNVVLWLAVLVKPSYGEFPTPTPPGVRTLAEEWSGPPATSGRPLTLSYFTFPLLENALELKYCRMNRFVIYSSGWCYWTFEYGHFSALYIKIKFVPHREHRVFLLESRWMFCRKKKLC